MKMTKEQFLDLSSKIKNKLDEFLESIQVLEKEFLLENLFSLNLNTGFKEITSCLDRFEAKKSSGVYKDIIDATIDSIIIYQSKIEEKLQTDDINFADALKKSIKSLNTILEFKPTAPLILHRIWFGSFLNEKYQTFLLNFKKFNPEYKIIIWTDFQTINVNELENFHKFCNTNCIKLNNIREYNSLANYDLIEEELDKAQADFQIRRVHYARASDLARIGILISQGGLYTDTDTDCKDSYVSLELPFGLLLKKKGKTILDDGKLIQNAILYDLIAANPNNSILLLASKISRLDYDTYHFNKDTLWQTSKQPHVHQHSTMLLTGSAIMWALSFLILNKKIPIDRLDNLFIDFIDTEYSMPSSYDKSWMEDLNEHIDEMLATPIEKLNAEHQSLLCFLNEIQKSRENYFPITAKSNKHYLEQFGIFSFANPAFNKDNACEYKDNLSHKYE